MGYFVKTEVEPISTFVDFGEREFLVADERGYEHLLYKMAENFLLISEGKILDNRLKLNKVITTDKKERSGKTFWFLFYFFVVSDLFCFRFVYRFYAIIKATGHS